MVQTTLNTLYTAQSKCSARLSALKEVLQVVTTML